MTSDDLVEWCPTRDLKFINDVKDGGVCTLRGRNSDREFDPCVQVEGQTINSILLFKILGNYIN